MKYYKGLAEGEFEYDEGTIYLEIHEDLGRVVRQVEEYERACFTGRWNGVSLEGHISDQKLSQADLAQTQAISAEEFERAWTQANQK